MAASTMVEEGPVAPTQESLSRQKKDLEEVLRLCYLGSDEELEKQANECGATRVSLAKDKKQRGGLHFAASKGKTSTVRMLIARYACDADAEDADGRTPLHFAATQGHTETVSVLCTFGRAWVDSSDGGDDTPLHLAARAGHASACLELLEQGASPHARNSKGLTPVGEAVVAGHEETVRAIGDRVFACLQDRPKSFSLLHLACGQSRPGVASYLLDKVPALLNDTHNPQRLSPLHSCVLVRSAACARVLVQAKCELGIRDSKGNAPIDLLEEEPCLPGGVASGAAGEGDEEIRRVLANGGAAQGKVKTRGSKAKAAAAAAAPRAEESTLRESFLRQLAGELRDCGGSFEKQKGILLLLSQKYSADLSALERCLGRGLSTEAEGEKAKSDVVSALAKSIAELDRIEKGLEVLRTLKAAHEDEDIQGALRSPQVREQLQGHRGDGEALRRLVASEEFGMTAEVNGKLQGLRVFFRSRGFTPSAFSKEIAVHEGTEEETRRQDEQRIGKLEETMTGVAQSAIGAVLKFSQIEEGGDEPGVKGGASAEKPPPSISPKEQKTGAEKWGTTKDEIWQACKRQLTLSVLSLVCTFVLMWLMRRSGTFSNLVEKDRMAAGDVQGVDSLAGGDAVFDEL